MHDEDEKCMQLKGEIEANLDDYDARQKLLSDLVELGSPGINVLVELLYTKCSEICVSQYNKNCEFGEELVQYISQVADEDTVKLLMEQYKKSKTECMYGPERYIIQALSLCGSKNLDALGHFFIYQEKDSDFSSDMVSIFEFMEGTFEDVGFVEILIEMLIDRDSYKNNAIISALQTFAPDATEELAREVIRHNCIRRFEKESTEEAKRIINLSGTEFEQFASSIFERMGYEVETTPYKDLGTDLIIQKNEKRTAIQAKNCQENVGVAAVQQVVASMAYYKCNHSMVIANSFFTSSAQELADVNNVKLIDRFDLRDLIVEAKIAELESSHRYY